MPANDNRRSAVVDQGVIEIRGGGPGLDRDEHFVIRQHSDGGYEIDTEIREVDERYRLQATLRVDHAWRPQEILARAEEPLASTPTVRDYCMRIENNDAERQLQLEIKADTGAPTTRQLPMDIDTMVDIEPSTLPMWCMTRRYDLIRGGVQHFHWLGQSLIRDLTLTGLDIPIEGVIEPDSCLRTYRFTETYPSPAGDFVLHFMLQTDEPGWLQIFEVRSPSRLIRGVRRQA